MPRARPGITIWKSGWPNFRHYGPRHHPGRGHRLITGGIGHNLPQEAPQAFADAVIDVAGY